MKLLLSITTASIITALLPAQVSSNAAPKTPAVQATSSWFKDAQAHIERRHQLAQKSPAKRGEAKNIILFVGDGMGVSTVTASRILEGQNLGGYGEEHFLTFEKFPYTAVSKTYNVDAQTPDSAGTMTAIVTGVKTKMGVLGLAENIEKGKCDAIENNTLTSTLELVELSGMSTGIVSTASVTHATPAATYAKSPNRNWESNLPADAKEQGCQDIASQLIYFEQNLKQRFPNAKADGIDVILGGGLNHFLPQSPPSREAPKGARSDNKNLIQEWQNLYPEGAFVQTNNQLSKIHYNSNNKLLGLFSQSHMLYEADRKRRSNHQPSLAQMTHKAIELLSENERGFFLMVESGRIDHAHHEGNAYKALTDTIEFANAIDTALKNTDAKETLIIVTADHSHVFTIAGYPKRGNPILGKVVHIDREAPALALDQKPYTTLGYTNGRGAHHAVSNQPRQDLREIDTTDVDYHQQAHIPLSSETHGGEDVIIYGTGPGAHLIAGTLEQNVIFHVMEFAADLNGKIKQKHTKQKK